MVRESPFRRRAWVWDDVEEEPVILDADSATHEEILEALENTRRELYEAHLEIKEELRRLRREAERPTKLDLSPREQMHHSRN